MHYTPDDLFVGAIENTPHCSNVTEEQEIWSKFMLMVLLQGSQHFMIDDVPFRLNSGQGDRKTPIVFMLNVAKPSRLRFINESAIPLRKVMISAPTPWLERLMARPEESGSPVLRQFLGRHLAHFSFAPGRQVVQLAEKIIHPPQALEGELETLYLKAQALDIMWQACLALETEGRKEPQLPSLMSLRTCERIKEFILANLGSDLTIDRIAGEAGASPSTIQRHFKEHFGLTLFDFIRQKRLEAAHHALASEGISVAWAAHMAGYNNLSSFTTAFRKAYGVTPKQVRV